MNSLVDRIKKAPKRRRAEIALNEAPGTDFDGTIAAARFVSYGLWCIGKGMKPTRKREITEALLKFGRRFVETIVDPVEGPKKLRALADAIERTAIHVPNPDTLRAIIHMIADRPNNEGRAFDIEEIRKFLRVVGEELGTSDADDTRLRRVAAEAGIRIKSRRGPRSKERRVTDKTAGKKRR